ncbi:MAG TPA: AraC family transcriptional regulator [Bacteroidales bacterium]|nr:AraC family transcriptional regulator [Bacteroidales bacterium]
MKIYLKNIVCPELEKLGVNYKVDELGIEITSSVSDGQKQELDKTLQPCNLILTPENNSVTVKKIKAALKDLLYYSSEEMKSMLPRYIQQATFSYNYLDNIFDFETGLSIEEFFSKRKIDWAKKLLTYYNLNLTEVTYQLGYDSIEQFAEDFKMVSGITPAQFKMVKSKQQMSVMEEA